MSPGTTPPDRNERQGSLFSFAFSGYVVEEFPPLETPDRKTYIVRDGTGVRPASDLETEMAMRLSQLEGLESVTRCNDPDPNGDGMRLCDLWPGHSGPHATAEGFEWRRRDA